MKRFGMIDIKFSILILCCFLSFTLSWCWGTWNGENKLVIDVSWYTLNYNWNTKLWKVALKTDDLDEIIDLYQELWDNVWYRDSLLIAKRNSKWLWVNAFAQDNLDTIEKMWLTLSDIKKTQIKLKKWSENINALLIEYKITGWLIEEIPLLYMSQLFVPDGYEMKLVSFVSEDSSSNLSAINMFKNIN